MTLYQSRPTTVDAVQWRGDNSDEVWTFCKAKVRVANGVCELLAGKDGAQGWVPVPVNHWLVMQPGDNTDIWPVEADYFYAKYDLPAATPHG